MMVKEFYQGIPPNGVIFEQLCLWEFILADDLFAKILQRLATWLSVNNIPRGKLVSLLQKVFDDKLKGTSVAFFVVGFNSFICETDNFKFTAL